MTSLYRVKVAILVALVLTICIRSAEGRQRLGANRHEDNARRQLMRIQAEGGDPPAELFLLGRCIGDCDTDDDCAGTMICFQREAYEEVPGCTGGENDDTPTDYCITDPNAPPGPTVQPTQAPTESPSPAPTASPTFTSEPSIHPSESPSSSPTYAPFGRIQYVGNEGTFYTTYPMPICKGDCDTDDDCAAGLYCHQRDSFESVPFCDGGRRESSTADFCSWDGTGEPPVVYEEPPEGQFRLKLYWEEGYLWQNETFEREWCMMYNYDGYPGIGKCWYGEKDRHCDNRRVYVAKCIQDPRMWFSFVNVTNPYSIDAVEEFLIMTGDGQRCFERKYREISLEECEPDNSNQRFFALNGDFFGEKFEISQLGFTHQCVTNDHHPKSGEVIETHDCVDSRAEDSQTSYWERY